MREDEVQIVIHKRRERRGRAHSDDVDHLRPDEVVDGVLKARPVDLVEGVLDFFDVGVEDFFEQVGLADAVVRDFDSLDGRELRADHLLKRVLKLRVSRETELVREPDNGRLGDADKRAELRRGHVRRFVVVREDE